MSCQFQSPDMSAHSKNGLRCFFGSLALLAFVGMFSGCAVSKTAPAHIRFRVITYNIHHGEGLDGKVDLIRIAELIKQERADIVALQEVDRAVRRTAGRDLPAELAALTGMTAVFSNNFHFQGGEYGNAVLTRFTVKQWTNHRYKMIRAGEQRGILKLTLDVHGRDLVLMNTHIDSRADDTERWLNVGEIESLVSAQGDMPFILCGDFNDMPGSRVHRRLSKTFADSWALVGAAEGFSFPADKPARRIDYIWISKGDSLKPIRAWLPQSAASDHLPLVVEFEFK
jgi:endonuclease/exonuclease/phosphatase family metal-dependent hydrolase